jgi:hypothetical protein
MTSFRYLPFLAAALLALPGVARPSAGAESAAPEPVTADAAVAPASEGRELGGHLFMPTLGIRGPFAATNFGTFLTVGEGSSVGTLNLTLPDGTPKSYSGSVSYVAIGGVLSYEYQFLRGVSARLGLSESLYSGTTGASLAVVGTNVRLGLIAGLTAGMTIGDSIRLAAVIDASSAPRMGLLLGPAIKSAFESCQSGLGNCTFDFGQLFQQQNILEVQPGLAASWAPMRALGLTANLSYSWSSVAISGADTVSAGGVSMGAAVDFDFLAVSRVPVGLQLTWASLIPVSGEGNSRYTDVGGGLFYTGRRDLSLGLQLFVRRFAVVPEVEVSWTTVMAMVGLRYYW